MGTLRVTFYPDLEVKVTAPAWWSSSTKPRTDVAAYAAILIALNDEVHEAMVEGRSLERRRVLDAAGRAWNTETGQPTTSVTRSLRYRLSKDYIPRAWELASHLQAAVVANVLADPSPSRSKVVDGQTIPIPVAEVLDIACGCSTTMFQPLRRMIDQVLSERSCRPYLSQDLADRTP